MATTAKSTSEKSGKSTKARRTRRTNRPDPLAVKLLKQDHREVENWFDESIFEEEEAHH